MLRLKMLFSSAVLVLVAATPVYATFHLMQVEQIIGGVDGDPTAQAIQLRMRGPFQNLVQNSRIVVWDAAGANPIIVADPGVAAGSGAAGDRVLFASANFATVTSPAVAPDYAMLALIPSSYLAAGSLTFENNFGTFIVWRVSWGGASYTGSHLGAITNDADGNFGPGFGGPLPSTGVQALRFTGAANALSTQNVNNYALSAGAAVFTNNAGASFTVESTATSARLAVTNSFLSQNYPNPFNPATTISFSLTAATDVRLSIYDASGRAVTTLINGVVGAGTRNVEWRGQNSNGILVSTGVYFYQLVTPNETLTRKMVLLK